MTPPVKFNIYFFFTRLWRDDVDIFSTNFGLWRMILFIFIRKFFTSVYSFCTHLFYYKIALCLDGIARCFILPLYQWTGQGRDNNAIIFGLRLYDEEEHRVKTTRAVSCSSKWNVFLNNASCFTQAF